MIKIFIENPLHPDGYETKITAVDGDKKQTFRTFTYAKQGYPDMEMLKHFGFHLQELGRMLCRTAETGSLIEDKN